MHKWWCVPIVLLSLLLPVANTFRAQAQADLRKQDNNLRKQDEIVLQLVIPGYMQDILTDELFDTFEAEHPGVRVELIRTGGAGVVVSFGARQQDIEDVLDDMAERVQSADVLAIDSSELTPEVTRAGYFLDLLPLINSDTGLDSSAFYSAVWQSFQWEGGFWALPVAADPVLLFYDRAAFDAAGLSYPDTWQSISDIEFAIRTLTELDADGKVAKLGFMNQSADIGLLLFSLFNQSLLDNTVLESTPQFDNTDLENLLTVWAQMQTDGLFNLPNMEDADQDEIMEMMDAPLQLGRSAFSMRPDEEAKIPALLPGGRAGLTVNGFAVSSGTQYPELAYELVKFLANSPQSATAFLGSNPARRDLAGAQPTDNAPIMTGPTSPELVALLPTALENGIPVSEARFSEYLSMAVDQMVQDEVDASTALQNMEVKVLERLNTASERHGTTQIVVQTPAPSGTLESGEIVLNFGVSSLFSALPNQDQWDAFAADFAASDPEVGLVNVESGFDPADKMAEQYDCFLSSGNAVPTIDLSLLRSLDPLLDNDPTFDPNDMISGVMQQVQRDGQTWALPLAIQPLAMRYDTNLFAQAGALAPVNGWTMAEFESALRAIQETNGTEPFVPRAFGNTHLLMLIAAYGGLPIDYRTTPPTINFTDPATVQAIRQVLDLAKNGYMDYSELANLGGIAISIGIGEDDTTALYTETVNGVGGFGGMLAFSEEGEILQNPDPMVLFPQGDSYTAASYDITTAYISANTPHIDACYRFISALAQQPGLVTSMPVRRSMIDSTVSQGEEAAAFYKMFDALLQQPNVVTFPSGISSEVGTIGDMLFTFWLNRAFDRYVKEDADLEVELADAQTFTSAYQECAANAAPFDPAVDDFQTYYQRLVDCAVLVDPTTSDYLNQ